MSFITEQLESKVDRRTLLRFSSYMGATLLGGSLLAGCGGSDNNNNNTASGSETDRVLLNFALNLEYLEAEYYLRSVTGSGLDASMIGAGLSTVGDGAGEVTVKSGSTAVGFTDSTIGDYAAEIASDELNHVRFLRSTLGGAAVARPAIDLLNSFNLAYQKATGNDSATFDPFADQTSFLLGAFIFEDVGVTAYKGAIRLLSNKTYLEAAAGILATEAYHAGAIRTVLNAAGQGATTVAISDARDKLDGTSSTDGGADLDQGVGTPDPSYQGTPPLVSASSTNLVPSDSNSIAFTRSSAQILGIVYLGGAVGTGGGFFPSGLNGNIR